MTDVISMLQQDHREVEGLFAQIKVTDGDARGQLVSKLAAKVRLHMQVEEAIVYPAVARQVDDGDDMVHDARADHDDARRVLADVERLPPDDPRFDGALALLETGIAYHVEEEEDEIFPSLREAATAEELDALGETVAAAKGSARASA